MRDEQKMGFKTGMLKKIKGKRKKIDSRLLICVECGSIQTSVSKKSITCRECGATKRFKNTSIKFTTFKVGDSVKIVDSKENSELIYQIKKMKKSKDGAKLYLLKSDLTKISLLYHENSETHLEKID